MSYKVFAVIISAAMLCTMLAGCKDKAGDMNKNSLTIGNSKCCDRRSSTGKWREYESSYQRIYRRRLGEDG